jgi:N-acetylglucosamine kinase-like BadF-type ATPase
LAPSADEALLVAIDGGGSRSRAALARGETVLARVEAGPLQLTTMNRHAIRRVLDQLLDGVTHGAEPHLVAAICLGIAGGGNPQRRSVVERWARERLPGARASVCRDVDLVLAAGGAGWVGIAAIAGTGAIVLGRNHEGLERHADGLGPLIGDRGGGFQLGLDAIRLALRGLDAKREPPQLFTDAVCEGLGITSPELAAATMTGSGSVPFARIAAIGGRVCTLAAEGETNSQRLVAAAAKELAASYRMVRRRLPGADGLPHLLAGGLGTMPAYHAAFVAAAGGEWQIVADPLLGGVSIAASAVTGNCDEAHGHGRR